MPLQVCVLNVLAQVNGGIRDWVCMCAETESEEPHQRKRKLLQVLNWGIIKSQHDWSACPNSNSSRIGSRVRFLKILFLFNQNYQTKLELMDLQKT